MILGMTRLHDTEEERRPVNLDQLNNVIDKKLPDIGQKYARDLARILSLEMEEDVKNVFTVSNVTNNNSLSSDGTVLHANHICADFTTGKSFMNELNTMMNDRQLHETIWIIFTILGYVEFRTAIVE